MVAVFVDGWSFYSTPVALRARHPDYWRLKPGGSVGLRLGVIGLSMLVLLLGYSLRKRWAALRGSGPLSAWLDLHILLGVLGPLFVLAHTSFKFGGIVSLSFWSMVGVSVSGVLGRYLYRQIPRTRAGEALSLERAVAENRALSARLRGEFGLAEATLERLEAVVSPPAPRGLLRGLLTFVADDLRRARALRAFERAAETAVPPADLARYRVLLREKARLHRRIALWDRAHDLFHYWHVGHKPFAIVMYVFALVHVTVASLTGYGW